MKIRKYVARNMPEALQQVRDDLGENAVILNTRQIRRNNRFNPEDEARVEVTAAFDESAVSAVAAAPVPAPARGNSGNLAAQRYAAQAGGGVAAARQVEPIARAAGVPPAPAPVPAAAAHSALGAVPRPAAMDGGELEKVMRQLRQLQDSVARMERRGNALAVALPDTVVRLGERLRNMGVATALTDELSAELLRALAGKALDDRAEVGAYAAGFLAQRLPPCKHIRIGKKRKVIGFFGSSGAGKTTAVAKIAAGFALKRKERIVVVSADDRRVGGLDQARAFAHIIGVALECAYGEEEMAAVLNRHDQAQLILVDAPGCGPNDQGERERQHRLFAAAGVQEVHVVIDALSSLEHMLDIVEASAVFSERRLLFTKTDEVSRQGSMLSTAIQSQIATSYMTIGCEVPGDIEAGELAKVVAHIVGHVPGQGH